MTGLAFTITSPNPSASQWGPDLTATRENIHSLMMYAASNGGRLPGWDTTINYSGTNIGNIILTNKADITVKIKIMYVYSGGLLTKEEYYFDKGTAGGSAGYEQITNGAVAYSYDGSNNLTAISVSSTYTTTP